MKTRIHPASSTRPPPLARPRRRAVSPGARAAWLCVGLLLTTLPAATVGAEDPFEVLELRVAGRPTQVWPVSLAGNCGRNPSDLMVLSVSEGPPHEQRQVTVFACDPDGTVGGAPPVTLELPPEVVALDVADIDERPGGELVWLNREGLTIVRPFDASAEGDPAAGAAARRFIAVPGGLPLPPRQRLVSRMPIVDDWDNDGRAKALVPTARGGLIIDLASGEQRPIEMPIVAEYDTWDPDLPARVRKLLIAMLHWPVLMRGDDNGDGRPDLFALTRWEVAIYHETGEGLPAEPTRRIALQPFDAETELRFESTEITYFATDVNGDGLTDLMLHRISGGFNSGLSETDIYVNRRGPNGAAGNDSARTPDMQFRLEKGFSGIEPIDLDGDGNVELIESSIQFGVMQMVRVLLTRKAEIKVRVLTSDPEDPSRLVESWSEDMVFKLNFGEGRVDGLMPNIEGDWNGDGRRDALYQHDGDSLGVRLGEATKKGPGFGSKIAEQPTAIEAGFLRIADLDGDGLDDFVAYDPRDAKGRLYVFTNKGVLPGTGAQLRSAEDGR